MNAKAIAALSATLLVLFVILIFMLGLVGHNNDQNWQVVQTVSGDVKIVDEPGYYWKGFSSVWTYPRTLDAFYSAHPKEGSKEDESIRVTFNDAGTANISSYVRVQLPTSKEQRRSLHRDFQGNPENIRDAIRAHLVNCLKASGPVMSASENQASRKAEFNQIVEEQLVSGLFKMRRTEIELNDLTELDGTKEKKAHVQATEIVTDKDGKPIVCQATPLEHYGVVILQFSITETEYDQQTLAQFSAKKESYLAAERAKAQRQEEVQQRLMIEEKGHRQVAEIQADENQKKERATIAATQAAEVAEIAKRQAVTVAQQAVEVAGQQKQEAEMRKQIAAIRAETAELEKKATIAAAEARQKELELGGGLSQKDERLALIKRDRDIGVATAMANIHVPNVMIQGAGDASPTANLINMALLKSVGILQP
jgi:hypothetical protein